MERVSGRDQILEARSEMAGWYMDAGLGAVQASLEDLNWAPGVDDGIAEIRQAGVHLALASVTWSFAVGHVATKLGIERYLSTQLDFDTGVIDHSWRATKAEYLADLAAELGIRHENIATIGDSSGDFDMLEAAGLGIFVGAETPDLDGVIHMPGADIRDVSETILAFEK